MMEEESVSLSRYEIASFMALLNMLKANLMEKEEVYKTLLAVLCDYNPQQPGSWEWAKRYINLLVSDKVLANCLLMSMPQPAPVQTSAATNRPTTPLQMLAKHHLRKNKRLYRGKSTPLLVKSIRSWKTVHRPPVAKESIGSKIKSLYNYTNEMMYEDVIDNSQPSSPDKPLDYRKPHRDAALKTCSSTTLPQTGKITNIPVNNAFTSLAQMHNYSQWMRNETLHLFQNPDQNTCNIQANIVPPAVNILNLPLPGPDNSEQQAVHPSLQLAPSPWQFMTNIDRLAYVASQSLNSSNGNLNTVPDVPHQFTSIPQAYTDGLSQALNLTQKGTDLGQDSGQTNKTKLGKDRVDLAHHPRSQSESDAMTCMPRLIKRKSDIKMEQTTELPITKPKQVKLDDIVSKTLKTYNDYEHALNAAYGTAPDLNKSRRNSLEALAELTASIDAETSQNSEKYSISATDKINTTIATVLSPVNIISSNTKPDTDTKSSSRKGMKTFPYSQKITLPNGRTSTLNFEGNSIALTDLQPSDPDYIVVDLHDNAVQAESDKGKIGVENPVTKNSSNKQLLFCNQSVMKNEAETKTCTSYGNMDQTVSKSENSSIKKSEICISYSRAGGLVISQPVIHYTTPTCRAYSDTDLSQTKIQSKIQNSGGETIKETNATRNDDDISTFNTIQEKENIFVSQNYSIGSTKTGEYSFPPTFGSQKPIRSSSVSTCVPTASQTSQTPEYTPLPPDYRMRSRSDSDIFQVPRGQSTWQQLQKENSSTVYNYNQEDLTKNISQTPSFTQNFNADHVGKALKLQTKGNQFVFKNSNYMNIASADSPLLRAQLSTEPISTVAVSNYQDMHLKQLQNTVRFFLKDNKQNTTMASISATALPSFCNPVCLTSLSNSELSSKTKSFSATSANKVQAYSTTTSITSTTGRSVQQNQRNPVTRTTNSKGVNMELTQLANTSATTCTVVPGISANKSVPNTSGNTAASLPIALCVSAKDYLDTVAKPRITTIGCNEGNTELDKYKRHVLHNDVRVRNTRFLSEHSAKPCRMVAVNTNIKPMNVGSAEGSQDGLLEVDDDIADEVFLEEFISQNVKKFTRKAVVSVQPQSSSIAE